ncbi:MAG: heterodisulfide reductase-related iron-sulfur binding cluster [Acidimicrobiaceae bacterium]|nr:heterodisulfide reductase-related iron-sulfur binding cluster [Acidimicrobiaceae bacterium]
MRLLLESVMDLGLDTDELASCVSCGLCLPHCPTFVITGSDTESPRGRIALMRAVQDKDAPVTDEVIRSMETCVQCRGCETACPSAVPFGRLMEGTRAALAETGRITPRWQRWALAMLRHRRLVLAGSTLLAVAVRLRLVPVRRLGLPARMPLRRPPLRASGSDVWLFTGCVMDAWQRDVHLAVQRVLEAAGAGVEPTGAAAPCCGALHIHAGLESDTKEMARQVMAGLSADDRPILVDSAGCGAVLKDYGHLLGSDEARAFSERVYDVHEWLAGRLDELQANRAVQPLPVTVAVQDPCHLRHVQRAHQPVPEVLRPFVAEIVKLDDDGLCCGAGGAYSMMERELSQAIRERKTASVARSGASVVASANPGCSLHLAAAGLDVRHPMELIDEALAADGATAGAQAKPNTGGSTTITTASQTA